MAIQALAIQKARQTVDLFSTQPESHASLKQF